MVNTQTHFSALETPQEPPSSAHSVGTLMKIFNRQIRHPLNAIIGFSDLLNDSVDGPEQDELIEIIQENARSLLFMFNRMLNLPGIGDPQGLLRREPVLIQEFVHEMLDLIRQTATSKSLTLCTEVEADVPSLLLIPRQPLQEIIGNLLENAEANTFEGRICIRVAMDEPNGEMVIEVVDTGAGIRPDVLNRNLAAANGRAPLPGPEIVPPGFGLFISGALATTLGGRLSGDSLPGQGSRIRVHLPVNEPVAPEAESIDEPDSRQRVLLADDSKPNQLILRKLLDGVGFDADIASNGREVFDKWTQQRYPMVFLDLQMPGVDGWTAARMIRQAEAEGPKNAPPTIIVATTGQYLETGESRLKEHGFDDRMEKPIRVEAIREIVKRHCPHLL